MAQWLRSIQGQLQEFATEVLNEATAETGEEIRPQTQHETRGDHDPDTIPEHAQIKIAALERHIDELRGQLKELNADIETIEEHHNRELAQKDQELQRIKDESELQSKAKDSEIRGIEARLEEKFFSVINAKDEEIARLTEELEESRISSRNDSHENFVTVDREDGEEETIIDHRDQEIQTLRQQLEQLSLAPADREAYEKSLDEKDRLIEKLRNELDSFNLSTVDRGDYEEIIVEKDREIETLRKQLDQISLSPADLGDLEEKISVKDGEIQELRKRLEELAISQRNQEQDEEKSQTIEELREELERLQNHYEEEKRRALATTQELQKKLSEAIDSSSHMKDVAMARMDEIRAENERLKDYTTQLETKGSEINDERATFLESKIVAIEEKYSNLLSECQNKDVQIEKLITSARVMEEQQNRDRLGLEEKIKAMEERLEKAEEEKSHLIHEISEVRRVSLEQAENTQSQQDQEKLGVLESRLMAAYEENEKLIDYCRGKEEELERIGLINRQLEEALSRGNSSQERLIELEERYGKTVEECKRREKETERLKAHLLQIEETSTREALEAQNREETLKEYIVFLENSRSTYSQSFEETNHHFQGEIEGLRARLKVLEAENTELRSKYEEEKLLRVETQNSLTSLQSVVRELAADSEREMATNGHERLRMQEELERKDQIISDLRADLERITLDKQAVEENIEALSNQLLSNRRLVEELEAQMGQVRPPKAAAENKIDDTILRELFLSYFTAPPDRKSDILLLLAKILEYSPEDYETIEKSLTTKATTWFAGHQRQQPSMNIVEQFVRYLETESESSRTAPQLPLPKESRPMATGIPVATKSEMIRASDSATTLQTLLQ